MPKPETLSVFELSNLIPDERAAEDWFIANRWSDGVRCPFCKCRIVAERKTSKRSWRCQRCHKDFSTKTATTMQGSNLSFKVWAWAIYLLTSSPKGISSIQLGKKLGITQKSAWHLAMRIRKAYEAQGESKLHGVVEVDETYIGGKEKNKHIAKKAQGFEGLGGKGKHIVMGFRERSGQVRGVITPRATRKFMQSNVIQNVREGSMVISDEHLGYKYVSDYGYEHEFVSHGKKEYVRGDVHTNGIESFWALLKRGYVGVYHYMSKKHLDRYVNEFAGRVSGRGYSTLEHMGLIVRRIDRKILRYQDLIKG